MTISEDLRNKIIILYFLDHCSKGTIAKELNVHPDVVRRVLERQPGYTQAVFTQASEQDQPDLLNKPKNKAPSIIDPFKGLIEEKLLEFPTIKARRLYDIVCDHGYEGGEDFFRHVVAGMRKRPPAEAFQRLRTLKGEQAQCDWAYMGTVEIGQAKRKLWAFALVLSYSRMVHLRFFYGAHMENFLAGHVSAFEQWGAVPRVILYDNLKSAVIEREGRAIHFNELLLALSNFYHFEARPCAPYRGNEKGRVERTIQFIRTSFFTARTFINLKDLNAQALKWCLERAANRPCPGDRSITVGKAFELEKSFLLSLPANPYHIEEQLAVKVGKTPYVRFDLNDYSVPHEHVMRTLEVRADQDRVRIFAGAQLIASHERSWDKGAQIEDAAHLEKLKQYKRQATKHRNLNRLINAVAECEQFLELAGKNHANIKALTKQLLDMLDRYGAVELQHAVKFALSEERASAQAVIKELERRRALDGKHPPLGPNLAQEARAKDAPTFKPQSLDSYSNFADIPEENPNAYDDPI